MDTDANTNAGSAANPAANDAASDQEVVEYDGRVPTKAFLGVHGLIYVLLLGWNFGLLWAWLRSLDWKVKLTSQRLVVTRGIVSQREEDIPLYRATDCGFTQTIPGRILGAGEITLISDDSTSPVMKFPFPEPRKYKELLREYTHKERKRMRSMDLS
jgi:hypothetical protein